MGISRTVIDKINYYRKSMILNLQRICRFAIRSGLHKMCNAEMTDGLIIRFKKKNLNKIHLLGLSFNSKISTK